MVVEKIWNFNFFLIFKRIEVKTIDARKKNKTILKSALNFAQSDTKRFSVFDLFFFFRYSLPAIMAASVSALPAKRFPSVNTLHSIAAGTCPLPLNVSLYHK